MTSLSDLARLGGPCLPRKEHKFSTMDVDEGLLEGGHLFVLSAKNQNNHTETVLIKLLLDPLALAFY